MRINMSLKMCHLSLHLLIFIYTVKSQTDPDRNLTDGETSKPINSTVGGWPDDYPAPPPWPSPDDPDFPGNPQIPANSTATDPVVVVPTDQDSSTTTSSTTTSSTTTSSEKQDQTPKVNTGSLATDARPVDPSDEKGSPKMKKTEFESWPMILIVMAFICILILGMYWSIVKYRTIKSAEREFEEQYKQKGSSLIFAKYVQYLFLIHSAVAHPSAPVPIGSARADKKPSDEKKDIPRTPTSESIRSGFDNKGLTATQHNKEFGQQSKGKLYSTQDKGSDSSIHTVPTEGPSVQEDSKSNTGSNASTASNRSVISNASNEN